jgi:hypothetical protein
MAADKLTEVRSALLRIHWYLLGQYITSKELGPVLDPDVELLQEVLR